MVDNSKDNPGRLASGIAKRACQILFVIVFQGVILFIAAGKLAWTWEWVFLGIYSLSVLINSFFMIRTSPETIAERGAAKGWKNWDKVVSGGWGLMQYLFIPLIAGLDNRFDWKQNPGIVWNTVGAGIFATGLGLFSWAMITNTFFSTAVRIQDERSQTVYQSGPYRIVRHPGYTGVILQSLGIPILLASWWAFVPGVIAVVFIIMRTYLEDRTLKTELKGYQEYTRNIRFRIIPGLW